MHLNVYDIKVYSNWDENREKTYNESEFLYRYAW